MIVDDDIVMVEPSTLCTLHDLMTSHRQRNLADDCSFNRISVDRETLWEDCLISFKNPKFDIKSGLRVKFIGEPGIDAGGLRTEFCSLLTKAMLSSPRLPYSRVKVTDVFHYTTYQQSNLFGLVGKMMSYIIVHFDVSIPCLSPCVYAYLATGDLEKAASLCTIDNIPDLEIKGLILEVNIVVQKIVF